MSAAILLTLGVIFATNALSIYGAPNPGFNVQESYIPMRDGVKLFTKIWTPRNISSALPILLMRTPYGVPDHRNSDGFFQGMSSFWQFNVEGFIIVIQDIRGRHKSAGEFVTFRPPGQPTFSNSIDEASDAYDTIDWLVDNVPKNSGKVGMFGISYDGWLTIQATLVPHPALQAISPQAPPINFFQGDDMHTTGGAFLLSQTFDWLAKYGDASSNENFVYPKSDMYEFFLQDTQSLEDVNRRFFHGSKQMWNHIVTNPDYSTTAWEPYSAIPFLQLKPNGLKTLVVGGWYDSEDLWGALKTYEVYSQLDPANTALVMGPWAHGYWFPFDNIPDPTGSTFGNLDFGSPTGDDFRWAQAQWFADTLKGPGQSRIRDRNLSPSNRTIPSSGAMLFLNGANEWKTIPSWPPSQQQISNMTLYLSESGVLRALPAPDPLEGQNDFDEYLSDPDRPVPYLPRPIGEFYNSSVAGGSWRVSDQRFSADRVDVLVYSTDPLMSNVTIAGRVLASIFVSTTVATDLDLVVKVIDRDAGGSQLIVADGVLRARYRNSLANPEPFPTNATVKLDVDLLERYHTFSAGHSIMLHLQSSWFPRIDRNPQKFVPNIFAAQYPRDFTPTMVRIHRSTQFKSHITLPILNERL